MEIRNSFQLGTDRAKILELLDSTAQIAYKKQEILIHMQKQIKDINLTITNYKNYPLQQNNQNHSPKPTQQVEAIEVKEKTSIILNKQEIQSNYEKILKIDGALRGQLWNLTNRKKQIMKQRNKLLEQRKQLSLSCNLVNVSQQLQKKYIHNHKTNISRFTKDTIQSSSHYQSNESALKIKLKQNESMINETKTETSQRLQQINNIKEQINSSQRQILTSKQEYEYLKQLNLCKQRRLSDLKIRLQSLNQQFLGIQVTNDHLKKQSIMLESRGDRKLLKLSSKVDKLEQVRKVLTNLLDRSKRTIQQYRDMSQIECILKRQIHQECI